MTHPVLTALGLTDNESGTYLGSGQWSATKDAGVLEPVNPTTGEVLGRVQASSQADYEAIVERAQAVYKVWRTTPAPRRGEAIRLCADALRTHKDALGSLVALEMGKSKPEGDGEVQEMIDIGEFAVGLSRQLYGLTMHSERPGHRMYEQWHPIGIVGVISAFNFPVAVWAWNSFVAAICGDITIWKPSPKTPLSAIAAMKICNEALKKGGFPDIFFLFNDAGSELAQQFVDDKRIPLISFTGSTKVGRMVGERVAQRMGRSLLELGGNNAIIVDQTRRPEARHPGDRLRRRRHRRPALHHHAPPVRARVDLRRRAGQAHRRLQAGREEDRRSDRPGEPDGPAQQQGRRRRLPRRGREGQGRRRQDRDRRRRDRGQGQLRPADDRHRPDQRRRRSSSTRPSRRSCT